MLYHQTKFDSKRIWNSEDISTITVIILLYEPCGHDPEDSNPFFSFSHDTPVYNAVPLYQVWLQHSNPVFLLDTLAYDDLQPA